MSDGKAIIFKKLGGRHQLSLDSPDSLRHVLELDDAHWMATSAPLDTFTCDPAFLKFLDSDSDGRIRSDELRAAVKWLFDALSDDAILLDSSDSIPLSAISRETETGKALLASAKLVLANLDAAGSETITLEQTRRRQDILSSGECNGDGVIPASAVEDAKLAEFVADVTLVAGGVEDAGGGKGVTAETVEEFMKTLNAYLEWIAKGDLKDGEEKNEILVWGKDTDSAFAALSALEEKIDQFFAQCALLSQDRGFDKRFNATDAEAAELDVSDPNAIRERLKKSPLTRPTPDNRLVFDDKINPFYKSSAAAFSEKVLAPWKKGVRIKNVLTSDEWPALKAEFAKFAEWRAAKPGGAIDKVSLEKLRSYSKAGHDKTLAPLFERDKAVAAEIARVEEMEKLILFKKHILEFSNNFVSFSSLYDPSALSILQVGRLVMDARHFDLNLKIANVAEHKKVATASNICVMYLKLTRKTGSSVETMNVATGVTSGKVDNIRIGKRGVFATPDGSEWDAVVVDFIQHPVSVFEALMTPFSKVGALVKKHTEKLKASAYEKVESGVDEGLTGAERALATENRSKTSAWTGPMMLLGGGIGVAGIGSAFASVMNALKGDGVLLKIGLFVAGIALVIATPIVIAAVLKLRHRNIAMILEACGWSVNASMRMNRRLGLLFTRIPAYPRNSRRTFYDQTKHYLGELDVERRSIWFGITMTTAVFAAALILGTTARGCLATDAKVERGISRAPHTNQAAVELETKRADDAKK